MIITVAESTDRLGDSAIVESTVSGTLRTPLFL